MKILVLRHGHAHPAEHHQADSARNLSDRGRADISKNFSSYFEKLPSIDLIWVSPLVRAQQTAQVFSNLYKAKTSKQLILETKNFIQPDDKVENVFLHLQKLDVVSVLLVTHQPLASYFIDRFCGTADGFHAMNTASMACISCEVPAPGLGFLEWIYHPV